MRKFLRAPALLAVLAYPAFGQTPPVYRAPEKPPRAVPSSGAVREPSAPLTRTDALALALLHSPDLAAFSWEVRAAEARALQAGLMPNPELDLRLWRLGEQNQVQDVDRRRLILSQDLEIGRERGKRVQVAELEKQMADLDYQAKRAEVATTVRALFAAVLGAQGKVDSHESHAWYLETMQNNVNHLVETGTMRSVEIHRMRRQVGLAQIDLKEARSDLEAARARLVAVWGNTTARFTAASGELTPTAAVPNVDSLIEMAQQGPLVRRHDTALSRSEAAVALVKSARLPDLSLGAGVRWEENPTTPDYIVDLELSIPVFDRRQGELREARYGMARARAERDAVLASAAQLITTFFHRHEAARMRVATLSDDVIPAAQATFDAYRLAFEARPTELGNLLDARRDLARAESDRHEALVEAHAARSMIERLVGKDL